MNRSDLLEFFNYDGRDILNRRHRHGLRHSEVGKTAGRIDAKGYRVVTFRQKKYKAHRLVWLYVNGHFPFGEIDHINRNRSDNRIENLRDVNRFTNMRNLSNVGVTKDGNRWKARLGQKYLGNFITYESAMIARKTAEIEHWG